MAKIELLFKGKLTFEGQTENVDYGVSFTPPAVQRIPTQSGFLMSSSGLGQINGVVSPVHFLGRNGVILTLEDGKAQIPILITDLSGNFVGA